MRQLDRGVRPKILFLTRSLEIGGAERQLAELAAGLHASGWDLKVALFYGGGAFESRLRDAGIELIDLKKGGRWDILGFALRLARLPTGDRRIQPTGWSTAAGR